MKIESERFGELNLDDKDVISFPNGLIGFPGEHQFVLLRPREDSAVGWLHSVTTTSLAFPVVGTDALTAIEYPDVPIGDAAQRAGVGGDDESICLMAVLSVSSAGIDATVNLLAPIIVNVETRQGAQILLERSRYSTREPFVLSAGEEEDDQRVPDEKAGSQVSVSAP